MKSWFSTCAFDWQRKIGRLSIRYSQRRSDGLMGRFGGGWNWKVGIQVGGKTVLISLLVAQLTLTWDK